MDPWRGCRGRGVALVAVKDAMGQSVRTSKYFGLFSVQIKGEEMRSTPLTCAQSAFLHEEDSKAQQWQTRGTIVISRSLRGITVEVNRTFQQESARAMQLLVKAAEALVRGETRLAIDVRMQEELYFLAPAARNIPSMCGHAIHHKDDDGGRE